MASVKALFLASGLVASSPSDRLPPPRRLPSDQLVVATTAQLVPVLRRAANELERQKPDLKVSILAVGSDVAMAELYTRRADLAVIGRAATDPEIKAFQWIFQHPPQRFALFKGSSAAPGHSPTIRLLVNSSNPIRSISLSELQAAYRSQRTVRWRDLGVSGPLAGRVVHPIMPDSEEGTGRFIRDALFDGATLFAWSRVREVQEPIHRNGSDDRMGIRLSTMVARDRQALALVPARPAAGTRDVPLTCARATMQCGPAVALERTIFAYSDAPPRPEARSFLQMFTAVGAQGAVSLGPYRQLPRNEIQELRRRLSSL